MEYQGKINGASIEGMLVELTDGELKSFSAILSAEGERRRAENDPNIITRAVAQPCVKKTSRAACPGCGRRDSWTTSKTLYGTPELAQGGEPIGMAVYCGACRAWFDPETGAWANMSEAYTY